MPRRRSGTVVQTPRRFAPIRNQNRRGTRRPASIKGPANPYATSPTLDIQLRTTIPAYVEQVLSGTPPEVAAKNLRMTLDAQEMAHVAHFFFPEALQELAKEEGDQKKQTLLKRERMLQEHFNASKKGLI